MKRSNPPNAPLRCIAVANAKGGTAKTTTTVALAEAFAARGRRVVVIDLDAQAAATRWLGVTPDPDAPGLLDALVGTVPLAELRRATNIAGVEVVPASEALIGGERVLAKEVGAETLLAERLRALPDPPDLVLCDCAPTVGLLALAALVAATEVLVPVECRGPALAGLVGMLATIEAVRTRLNKRLRTVRLLACRLDGRALHTSKVLEALRAQYGEQVCRIAIPENIALSVAATEGIAPARFAASSAGGRAYAELAEELDAPNAPLSPKGTRP